MNTIHYVIFFVGVSLEILILWRGRVARLWSAYPLFYLYFICIFLRTIVLFVLVQLRVPGYAVTYWISDAIAVLLRFFVIWEVFRQTFARSLPLRRGAGRVLMMLGIAMALVMAGKRPGLFFPDWERKWGLTQAVLLMATLCLARFYRLSLGRNISGMALGLGTYLSVVVVNFSAFELDQSFFPYWRLISPLSFNGMLGVWTWALWTYAPNPRPVVAAVEDSEYGLAHWAHAWSQLRTALRRAVGL